MRSAQFRATVIFSGLISAVFLFMFLEQIGWERNAALTAGITWLTALWWVLEPIPIPVTSLIPIALFPLMGVLTPKDVAVAYGSPLILLLLGGFILAQGIGEE